TKEDPLHVPDASGSHPVRTGFMPDLRHGFGADGHCGHKRRRAGPGIPFDAHTILGQRGIERSGFAARHVWRKVRVAALVNGAALDGVRTCWARRSVGRPAIFRALLGLAHQSKSEYVHAHRAWYRRRISGKPRGHSFSTRVPAILSRNGRLDPGLLRSGGSHHYTRTARASLGTTRACQNIIGHTHAAESTAATGSPPRPTIARKRCPARPGATERPPARASRRARSCGWRFARRRKRGGCIHGYG